MKALVHLTKQELQSELERLKTMEIVADTSTHYTITKMMGWVEARLSELERPETPKAQSPDVTVPEVSGNTIEPVQSERGTVAIDWQKEVDQLLAPNETAVPKRSFWKRLFG